MGQSHDSRGTDRMKVFLYISSLVAATTAAPQLLVGGHHGLVRGHGLVGVGAGQGSHQSVSKAFGATVAAVHDSPNALHGARHGIVASHGLVGGHAIAHAAAPVVHAAPVVKAAPAYHAPVVAHAAVEAYPDEVSPYTFNYAVADDYSASNFNAAESSDGAGSAQGSYNVNLPDGR